MADKQSRIETALDITIANIKHEMENGVFFCVCCLRKE